MTAEWRKRTVLITGAGGFIGSSLVECLVTKGAKVRAMVHYDSRPGYSNLDLAITDASSRLDVVAGDICDPYFVRSAIDGVDVVMHLAALIGIPYSYQAPASYVATNVQGTVNVLEACKACGVQRVVHTSTSECYGTARYVPIDEEHPLQAQSPYAASKIAADKLAEAYFCSFDLPVAVLRPFNTFGPRQSARAIIPTIISQLLWGGDELRLGNLEPVRDFTYVTDTCEGFCRIAECDAALGKVVHLGTGHGVRIQTVVGMLQEILGIYKPVCSTDDRVRPEKSEVLQLISNPAQAVNLLQWHPAVSLEEGLRRVADFVKCHPECYRASVYAV
jgi:NAD dependent epimerase/dehydratase